MAPHSKTGASTEGLARVQALDLLRLVAVLGVALFHYGFRGPTTQDVTQVALPELASFARYGFLGVPVFFIISGFVIAYSAEGRTATGFAIARIARIYPGFLFCMTLTFIMLLAFGAPQFSTSLAQWAANLIIAAPALHQPYMDSAYWSLIYEMMFYAWVTILMAAGLFPRRIDVISVVWLSISLLNELVLESYAISKIFLTDASGFFITGLLIYEIYLGRRDAAIQTLLAASTVCAVFQALHSLAWLRDRTGSQFDDWIVAAICLLSIVVILAATHIERLPLPGRAVLAIGGLTYPLYLLHQYAGYVVLNRIGPVAHPMLAVALIQLGIALLSWATWRYVERPSQRFVKQTLGRWAARFGMMAAA